MKGRIPAMSDEMGIKLTWEMVLEHFDRLIKFAAKQQVLNRGSDGAVSAEDLYQEGMIKLYDCWVKWCVGHNKDMDEFGPIFRKSLFRRVRQASGRRVVHVDLEDAANSLEDKNTEDVVERMYRDYGMQQLTEMLSSQIAKDLLAELISPSDRTMFEVWADTKRKEMLRSQGKRVNVPKDNTIRMKHIVRALGITGKQYDVAILEIKEKARLVLDYQF